MLNITLRETKQSSLFTKSRILFPAFRGAFAIAEHKKSLLLRITFNNPSQIKHLNIVFLRFLTSNFGLKKKKERIQLPLQPRVKL